MNLVFKYYTNFKRELHKLETSNLKASSKYQVVIRVIRFNSCFYCSHGIQLANI